MGWATRHIEDLAQGKTVKFRPHGNSMVPLVRSGDLCTVEPLGERTLAKGEIVLCKVRGSQYLHLVTAIRQDQVQISNNHGHVNGWTPRHMVYGLLTATAP